MRTALLAAMALTLGCSDLAQLISVPAEAQVPTRTNTELRDMAPKGCVYPTTLNVLAASTRYVEHGGDGTGDAVADYLPIPDGTMVEAVNRTDATTVKCCWTADPHDTVGDPAVVDETNEIGGADGMCETIPVGVSAFKLRVSLWSTEAGGYGLGVCDENSAHDIETSFAGYSVDVRGGCLVDADCASVGGHGAGATCETAAPEGELSGTVVRGLYLACRSTGNATVDFCIKR